MLPCHLHTRGDPCGEISLVLSAFPSSWLGSSLKPTTNISAAITTTQRFTSKTGLFSYRHLNATMLRQCSMFLLSVRVQWLASMPCVRCPCSELSQLITKDTNLTSALGSRALVTRAASDAFPPHKIQKPKRSLERKAKVLAQAQALCSERVSLTFQRRQ